MAQYNLELEIYRVFRLEKNASKAEIKKRYIALSLKFHPDKINGKLGRQPTGEERLTWADIQLANNILSDENQRIIYDSYRKSGHCHFCTSINSPCGRCNSARFNCPKCPKLIWQGAPGVIISKKSLRYFCSEGCAINFNADMGYTDNVHKYQEFDGNAPPPPPNPDKICPGCQKERSIPKSQWVALEKNSTKCCTDYCLYDFLTRQGKQCTICLRCNKVWRWDNNIGWKKKKGTNDNFCCVSHMNEYYEGKETGLGEGGNDPLLTEKKSAVTEIDNALSQNPSVTNFELEAINQSWRSDIWNATNSAQIATIKKRVLVDTQTKRSAKDPSDPLQTLKAATIAEIDDELLKEPEVKTSELEPSNQKLGVDIQNATSEDQIKKIRDNVLADIRNKRQAKKPGNEGQDQDKKSLDSLRAAAINQIREELGKQPSVDESEITNQKWEEEIRKASSGNAINEIRDHVLANIKNKRVAKQEANLLQELLTQAKQEENWNNYEKLESILKRIKGLRSSDAYKKKEQQIQVAESRLKELDPDKFKKTVVNSLDQQIKNNGLTDSNMDEETKAAVTEARQDPTPEKVAKAEEKIAQNGANNSLSSLITQIKKKIKQNKLSKTEKEKILTEILQFITKNGYQKAAYKKQKHQVDNLLTELKGDKETQGKPGISWPKVLGITTLAALPLIIVTFIILRARRRKLRKEK